MDASLDFQFAVISDLHVGLSHTIHDHPTRFHLVEWSIPALENVFAELSQQHIDFLLMPGDLTQHGEPENHAWLAKRLSELPFPTYVIPGNHDIPVSEADETSIAPCEFSGYYRDYGYGDEYSLEGYTQTLLPGVVLVGLNSNHFDAQGKQTGNLTQSQLDWLDQTLSGLDESLVLVMVHHNILEHFPEQTTHPIGHRYMLSNAPDLKKILKRHRVQFVFSGHLHVQDIAAQDGLVDITTGSLVSYPHPYRLVHFHQDDAGRPVADVKSFRVKQIDACDDVQAFSREWMGDRSKAFMMRMLTQDPLNLPEAQAKRLVVKLKYFWATIADGDPQFDKSEFPGPLQAYLAAYEQHQQNACDLEITDNDTRIPVLSRATVTA